MTHEASPCGEEQTLDYKGVPIRVLMFDGVPWFCLPDMIEALGWGPQTAEVVNGPEFPNFAQLIVKEASDDSLPPEYVDILSPVGVYYWASLNDPSLARSFTAWAKKEAFRLCPNPVPGDCRMFLSVLTGADGRKELPPYPLRYGGWRTEWMALEESDAWTYRDHGGRKPAPREPVSQALKDALLAEAAARITVAHEVKRQREAAGDQAA